MVHFEEKAHYDLQDLRQIVHLLRAPGGCPWDYDAFDLLIGMDQENLWNIRRICGGDPEGKIHLLLDFTSRPGSVADPWYTGDFETTWRDVDVGCRALLRRIQTKEQNP